MPLRYWVPLSLPWRFSVVGSWMTKKISRISRRLMASGSYSSLTTSLCPCAACAHLLVTGLQGFAVAIARLDVGHAAHFDEYGLGAPKAAAAEDDGLRG
jgi:hypothetical protein